MNDKKMYPALLIYLIIITLSVTAVSLSRYSTLVEENSGISAARPILSYEPQSAVLNGNSVADFANGINLSDVKAGDKLVFRFDIVNMKGSTINQVLLKYKINVKFDPAVANLPLTYTLQPSETYDSAGGDWVYMGFGERITHSYTLTVSWDESANGPDYLNKQQNIQIIIDAEQADAVS